MQIQPMFVPSFTRRHRTRPKYNDSTHRTRAQGRTASHLLVPLVLLIVGTWQSGATFADEAEVLAQLQQSRQRYQTAETWAERRATLRKTFLQGARLWPLPERPAVRAIVHSRRQYGDYSVENVALETLPGFYCTGNLYRPVGRKELGPAILCPHGHFRPLGRFRENHQIRCAHLARMGATVFSYSMVGWQDAQNTTHDDPLVLALQTWNSLRVVDYLSAMQRVDAQRIGITGASGGGTQSMFLSLIDDRIKASAPLVIVYPWAAPEGCLCEGGMPVMQAAGTNAIELAAATAPRPQLLISVGNDPTQKFPQVGFPFIQQMYRTAGAAENVRNVHLADEGHDFGATKRKEVYRFFAKHLRMQANAFVAPTKHTPLLEEDRGKIKIETPEQMMVFDKQHPRPGHSISGAASVAKTFDSYLQQLRAASPADAPTTVAKAPRARYAFQPAGPQDEALLFTPLGFDKVGEPRVAEAGSGTLKLTLLDAETKQPTPCRVNVVGSDGHYYEPAKGSLKEYGLTGVWPQSGWGNRQGKAPIRYLGRFFYSAGSSVIQVPPGAVRVEVWKGFEYRPVMLTTRIVSGQARELTIRLPKTASMPALGYWSGDPHIHIQRRDREDEERILDLLEAEDIHFGSLLAYNDPAGPYTGRMQAMDAPQFRGLGKRSITTRRRVRILSGQEYRSGNYGHLNIVLLDHLVAEGDAYNTNHWPPFGHVARQVRKAGGIAFYAHGGYAQEIYADVVQDNIDAVELLQFGVYRGIGLEDWYHMLNSGFRLPAVGACDYPACRKLGDCKTYVGSGRELPSMEAWLRGMARGESFVTSGPLLLLDVNGKRPGAQLEFPDDQPCRVEARVRVRCEVAPVTHVQLIANGRVVRELRVPPRAGQGEWIELNETLELEESAWIAARAFSRSPLKTPDAEAHTNPVYVYRGGRAPYDRDSLDRLVAALDAQIAIHKKRKFDEQAKIIAYFERSRDILMSIRAAGGAPSKAHPSRVAEAPGMLEDPGRRQHTKEELKAFLRPQPPLPVDKAMESFETVAGFQMQLVAAEPLLNDPIAAAFDENGNLYVCEMRDYPFQPAKGRDPIGSVRLLRDTDGDGTFDKSHLFADKLLWAGGVAPWKGGVFVAAAPDIWYLKDTDGDFQADVRKKVYTGFGTANQQAMLNNLTWGLDHRIYGSTAGNGGNVTYVDKQAGFPEPIPVSGSDFRFSPRTQRFETITGTVQFGTTFDDWGNRFLCSESRPLLHPVLPQHYLQRNPHLPVANAIQNLTPGPVSIFRISPLERWRMIRSSRRIAVGARSPNAAGASHHVIDAAAGVTIYRGGAYPKQYYGNVFIGGAQSNLIHRRLLDADGVTFASRRADAQTEFVRSSDNWFRPVNFVNAPDGTLYVLDMSREILETIHVPLDVTPYLDFTSGRKHGRIYRLAPPKFSYPGPPTLGKATTAQLVQALGSPHGWYRDTAHRLIYERQDPSAVPLLRKLLAHPSAATRLHVLWSLNGLAALREDDLLRALEDPHTAVLEHAIRLAEAHFDSSPRLLDRVIELADSTEPRTRLQVAFSLGESASPKAATALAQLARTTGGDRWMRTAVLSSVSPLADRMLIELLNDPAFASSSAGRAMLKQLAVVVGTRGQVTETDRVLETLAAVHPKHPNLLNALISGILRSGKRFQVSKQSSPRVAAFVREVVATARSTATDTTASEAARRQALQIVGSLPFDESHELLTGMLDVTHPESLQREAVRLLASYREDEVAGILLSTWTAQTPEVRKEVIDALFARPARVKALLLAVKRGEATMAQVDGTRRSLLLQDQDAETQSLAKELLGDEASGSRGDVIRAYLPSLELKGDATRGQAVFRAQCAACHRLGNVGHAIGPNLASSPSRDAEVLLTHILAPNKYLLPNYETYLVVDDSGRVHSGMLASQSATSITLKREENKTETILRGNVEQLKSTGKSLMPEGLEAKINQQAMADLIRYLQSTQTPAGPMPLGIGTLPGLVEPEPTPQ